jgi:tetratricopeptide (TPR) repeat protein
MKTGDHKPGLPFRLHRELVLLIALTAIGGGVFVGAREFAAANSRMRLRDASEWYRRGIARLETGEGAAALPALRRASGMDPGSLPYVLRLAEALREEGGIIEARQVLDRFRRAAPEDADVNVEIARFEARAGDVSAAVRSYQTAIGSLWRVEETDRRAIVRRELIRYLLANGERNHALSEVLVLAANLPPDVDAQIEAGRLFLEAGDAGRALERFAAAVERDPANSAAMAGAGEAAFARGDYLLSRRYLAAATNQSEQVVALRTLVELVLTNDPLAPRLSPQEREARVAADLAYASTRLGLCATRRQAEGQDVSALEELRTALTNYQAGRPVQQRHQNPQGASDSRPHRRTDPAIDQIETGLELAAQIAAATGAACAPAAPMDRALVLIGRAHGLEPPES